MNAREAIRNSIQSADFVVNSYLGDLSDADLLVRPVPGANHIAWQLGHLVIAEHGLMSEEFPGAMPALPAGFMEKHNNDTASSDDPKAFLTKAEYQRLWAEQRAATLAQLAKISDADLDKPAPEKYRSFLNTVGDLINLQGSHALMHAGQWAIVRRKLGRKPLF